jgi:3-oxoacyl-[acyl-carrier-protein] synthase II
VAAEADLDAVEAPLTPLERRRWSRADKFGVVAAQEALDDSGLLDAADRSRVGVVLGAGTADLIRNETFYETTLTRGIRFARPSDAWNHFSSTPVDIIAARFGLEACAPASSRPARRARSRSGRRPTRFVSGASMPRLPAARTRSRG